MDRKDEIISRQNDLLQDMLKKQFKSITEDLWGLHTELTSRSAMDPFKDLVPPVSPVSPVPDKKADKGAGPKSETSSVPEAAPAAAPEAEEQAPEETIEDLKAELDSYIGLSVIKSEVNSLINWIGIMKARQAADLPTPDLSLHMVFSGNPGTGKTMIARLMARIYKCLGILSKGHLVEVDRSGLVAGYVGQTALKTQEVINKALGGVLFIDEAYALTENRGGTDYGQEAVDTILKAMEDHRDDLIVIVAGYTELMQSFISSNPGLESRFNRFMQFPDYTVDELVGIFEMRCGKSCYSLSEDAKALLPEILREKSKNVKGFGNGRGVRNLFENAISNQADRLSQETGELTRERLMEITAADLKAAAEESDGDSLEKAAADAAIKDLMSSVSSMASSLSGIPAVEKPDGETKDNAAADKDAGPGEKTSDPENTEN
ncbi:MAG: AAA family ATPase [Clostridia bacterium]|nr:AAA family ATPase [Clostridia bacterium]